MTDSGVGGSVFFWSKFLAVREPTGVHQWNVPDKPRNLHKKDDTCNSFYINMSIVLIRVDNRYNIGRIHQL